MIFYAIYAMIGITMLMIGTGIYKKHTGGDGK